MTQQHEPTGREAAYLIVVHNLRNHINALSTLAEDLNERLDTARYGLLPADGLINPAKHTAAQDTFMALDLALRTYTNLTTPRPARRQP